MNYVSHSEFVDALRHFLGLDPIPEANVVRNRKRQSFGEDRSSEFLEAFMNTKVGVGREKVGDGDSLLGIPRMKG